MDSRKACDEPQKPKQTIFKSGAKIFKILSQVANSK
jgi:hypothetical protein